jgi:predicted GTPase
MGAAGRDFHDFLTFFRSHPDFEVCCFTAAQIPFIEQRSFPRELAGSHYTHDIPIFPETQLSSLIARYNVDFVFLAYSDLPHSEVMHRASLVQAAGASFALLGPKHTALPCRVPVVAVTAVRTGAGKSPLSRMIAIELAALGLSVSVLRHPMPYGDLQRQRVQRFGSLQDLDTHACSVEEREEYAPYLERGLTVWAGVDYAAIVAAAEQESDMLLWDGGNNDMPFLRAGLHITVLDALRPGHERNYYPGESNFLRADVLVINKVEHARPEDLELIARNCAEHNPRAIRIESDLVVQCTEPEKIAGRRVLVVEDGPTLTHGGMSHGAGWLAARRGGAAELIDPRRFAVGTIAQTFAAYPHIGPVLPALGYSSEQRAELLQTINAAAPDVIVDASPARLDRVLALPFPVVRVQYTFKQRSGPPVMQLIERFVRGAS